MTHTRVHLIAPPNVQTTSDYYLDGFGQATIRFARVLKQLGYHVTLYASEENEAPCDELVPVITKAEQQQLLGGHQYQYAASTEACVGLWTLTNPRIAGEIARRKQPRDFICLIGGTSQESIARVHPDLMTVEYSIGYLGSFAKYRVFESHALRNQTHGLQQHCDGRFFDTVIPLFFDAEAFPVHAPEPFLLYVGRLTPKKGLEIACEAAYLAGAPLKVIGHGDRSLVTHGAEYLGVLPDAERNEWMARASALMCPTLYLEPFGAVAVEAQLCGTPVISTNFGGFVETVIHGVTGYRCDYLGEFVQAIGQVGRLDRSIVRACAQARYSIDAVVPQYGAYFERLLLLWEQGWRTHTTTTHAVGA